MAEDRKDLWVVLTLLASTAVLIFGIHCLVRYQSPADHHRRELGKDDVHDAAHDVRFPWQYHATGSLSLPFDDIVEPFEAWFAGDVNMSRIDYYHGVDRTIQRGDVGKYGEMFKIVPMHSDLSPSNNDYISCWYKSLPKWLHKQVQTVVPMNLKNFVVSAMEVHREQLCYKFVRRNTEYNKTNTYILYVTAHAPHRPLRFEMIGYDDMMTSHYDHYILDYTKFEPWTLNSTIFDIPTKEQCNKKHHLNSIYLMNPMAEYLHLNHAKDEELERSYHHYKIKHRKTYNSSAEHEKRKHIYKHNLRFIHSKNRQNLKYILKANHLTDLTDAEMRTQNGLLHDEHTKPTKHLNFNISKALQELPENLDWREYGAVTPVHSQGICGSCWAFSALGAVEGMNFFKTGKLVELSKQQLLDCSWPVGNHGCRGGFQARSLRWIKRNGVATKKEYGNYLAQEGFCHCGNCTTVEIDGFMHIKKHAPPFLKIALATHGPIASSVNSDSKTFRFYSHGIYDDPQCKRKTNHAVLTVGYGNHKGTSYWLIRNSWGHLWGDNGYIKIAAKHDICGTTSGSLIAIKKTKQMKEFPFKYLPKLPKSRQVLSIEAKMEPLPFK